MKCDENQQEQREQRSASWTFLTSNVPSGPRLASRLPSPGCAHPTCGANSTGKVTVAAPRDHTRQGKKDQRGKRRGRELGAEAFYQQVLRYFRIAPPPGWAFALFDCFCLIIKVLICFHFNSQFSNQ